MEKEYYVYVYLDPRKKGEYKYGDYEFDYEPFYVGKGKDYRYKRHLRESEYTKNNNYKNNKIKKIINCGLKPIVIKFRENLTESLAHELEEKMILEIGRYDLGLGPLANFTNGGEGNSGQIMSEETKEKLREINLGKVSPFKGKSYGEIYGEEEAINKIEKIRLINLGKTYEEIYGEDRAGEIKEKIRLGNLGKVYSEETREKIRQNNLGRKATKKTRDKISKSLIGNDRRKDCKHSEETKKKISESKKGTVSWNAQPVLQLDKEGNIINEWRSAKYAAEQLGLSQGNIWSVINGDRNTCGGFKWKLK